MVPRRVVSPGWSLIAKEGVVVCHLHDYRDKSKNWKWTIKDGVPTLRVWRSHVEFFDSKVPRKGPLEGETLKTGSSGSVRPSGFKVEDRGVGTFWSRKTNLGPTVQPFTGVRFRPTYTSGGTYYGERVLSAPKFNTGTSTSTYRRKQKCLKVENINWN